LIADGAGALGAVGVPAAGGLKGGEYRGPCLVQVHELADPLGEVGQPGGVGRDARDSGGELHDLLAELAGESPEHVVLAGKILVVGGAGAAGPLGDEFNPGPAETQFPEYLEGGGEYAALGVAAALTDHGIASERRPPPDFLGGGRNADQILRCRHWWWSRSGAVGCAGVGFAGTATPVGRTGCVVDAER
jgi:hypothetical protein